jgi:hypothetical protein
LIASRATATVAAGFQSVFCLSKVVRVIARLLGKEKLTLLGGSTERSAAVTTQERRRGLHRRRRQAVGWQVPPNDRRRRRPIGEREGSERRSEIDRLCGLGMPKSLPRFRGRASRATAATGGLPMAGTRTSWYDAAIGRWISEDPMSFTAGDRGIKWDGGNTVRHDIRGSRTGEGGRICGG